MLEEQIRALVQRYLDRQIDRSEFSEQFAGLYIQVRNSRNASLESRNLCNCVMLPFAELSRGNRSEGSFREELAKTVHPFAPHAELVNVAVYVGQHMTFGKPVSLSGNNSMPIFRTPPKRYMRALDVKIEGRTHSAYTYAPMGNIYGFGYSLEDPDLASQALPLHAEPV